MSTKQDNPARRCATREREKREIERERKMPRSKELIQNLHEEDSKIQLNAEGEFQAGNREEKSDEGKG